MNTIPRVAFDIDGVLAGFSLAFLDIINREFGKSLTMADWKSYNFETNFSKEETDRGWEVLLHTEDWWAQLPVYESVPFERMDFAMRMGYFNGFFVTRRQDLMAGVFKDGIDAQYQTCRWLRGHGINHSSGIVATGKLERVEILKLLGADVYLEDWGEQFLQVREAGIDAYLIDRPYNQHIVAGTHRVASVGVFLDRMGIPSTYISGYGGSEF